MLFCLFTGDEAIIFESFCIPRMLFQTQPRGLQSRREKKRLFQAEAVKKGNVNLPFIHVSLLDKYA